jgi:hypothetical protein
MDAGRGRLISRRSEEPTVNGFAPTPSGHAKLALAKIARELNAMPVLDKRPLQEIVDGLTDLHAYIVAPRGRRALTG